MIVIGHFSTLRGAGHKLYTRLCHHRPPRAVAERTVAAGLARCGYQHYWQVAVRDYLAFYYRQTYFANPHNAFEAMWAEQVDATVDTLHGQQMGIVTRFLTANETVLRELATVIRSKSILSRDDLQPFFARVTFPDHFPRPGGVV